jgi:hypothetical protein
MSDRGGNGNEDFSNSGIDYIFDFDGFYDCRFGRPNERQRQLRGRSLHWRRYVVELWHKGASQDSQDHYDY